MPTLGTMLTFAAAVAVFAAIPGPSNLYVVAQTLGAGRRAGYRAAVGCALGASIYVAAAAVGLAAVLASSRGALVALHYAGGLYLLYLAWTSWRSASATAISSATPRSGRYLANGFLVELANPKVAIFFVAFLPQFLSPDRGPLWTQVAVLGCLFALIGLASDSSWALLTGLARDRVASRPSWVAGSRRASSVVYAVLGSWALISGSRAVRA